MARELSPAELSDLLKGADRAAAKPTAVTPGMVGGQVLQALAAGAGAAALAGGLLAALAAPWEPLTQWSLTAGVIVAGAGLLVRAVPADRILSAQRLRMVQETVIAAEFRKRKAYEAIQEMEAQHAAKVAELEKTLTHMSAQYKVLRVENDALRERLNPQSDTFMAAEPDDPDTHEKARYILQRWFATLQPNDKGEMRGEWFSRDAAEASQWTQGQHARAVALLRRAGLITARGRFNEVLPTYTSLPAALHQLDVHYDSKRREPVMPAKPRYVESE